MLLALCTKRFSINRIFRLLTEKEIQVMSSQNRRHVLRKNFFNQRHFVHVGAKNSGGDFNVNIWAKYNVFVLSSEADLTSRNQNSSIFS